MTSERVSYAKLKVLSKNSFFWNKLANLLSL